MIILFHQEKPILDMSQYILLLNGEIGSHGKMIKRIVAAPFLNYNYH